MAAAFAALVSGCSDRDSSADYVPPPVVPAPERVREGTPNPLPIEPGKLDAPPKPTVSNSPKPTETEPDGLTEYGNWLAMSLRQKTAAEQSFRKEIQSASKNIDKMGFAALLPPYENYDRAVQHAIKQIRKLKPPASVKPIHEAILSSCSRLEENLQETVAAMHSADGGDTAAELNKDRKQIETTGTEAVQEAFDASGYDAAQFALHGIFVRKG